MYICIVAYRLHRRLSLDTAPIFHILFEECVLQFEQRNGKKFVFAGDKAFKCKCRRSITPSYQVKPAMTFANEFDIEALIADAVADLLGVN